MAQQLQDQHRSHTYLVEVILKPTDNIYGYGQTETTTLLRVALVPDVPWTYSRTVVPMALARTGLSLESWKDVVDEASLIWKERTVALATVVQREQQRSKQKELLALFCFVCIPIYCLVRYFAPWTDDHDEYSDRLSESEERWCTLAQKFSLLFEPHGIVVDTYRRNRTKAGRLSCWTVGLVFSFRMQPASADDEAWCTDNCRADDVQEEEYQNRKLRITKESHVLHLGSEFRSDLGREPCAAMAMATATAIAVINDHGDGEDPGDGGGLNEKLISHGTLI